MLRSNFSDSNFEAGVDEAGRGSLAGPVTAAAVILPKNYKNDALADSKTLSEKKRVELKSIIEKDALDFSVFFVNPNIIDKINILNSTIKAMHGALDKLMIKPTYILIDGNNFDKYYNIPHKCIIRGDDKFQNIAAASILAKTYRDDYMRIIHKKFPLFNWNKNKGYGTKSHIEMIGKFGLTKFHRKSFTLKKSQIKLEL
jgi:ribonuclease HII